MDKRFQVGDKVSIFVNGGWNGTKEVRFATIEAISPQAKVVSCEGRKFQVHRNEAWDYLRANASNGDWLEPYKESHEEFRKQIEAKVTRSASIRRLKEYNWSNLDNARLARVMEVLKQVTDETLAEDLPALDLGRSFIPSQAV